MNETDYIFNRQIYLLAEKEKRTTNRYSENKYRIIVGYDKMYVPKPSVEIEKTL